MWEVLFVISRFSITYVPRPGPLSLGDAHSLYKMSHGVCVPVGTAAKTFSVGFSRRNSNNDTLLTFVMLDILCTALFMSITCSI